MLKAKLWLSRGKKWCQGFHKIAAADEVNLFSLIQMRLGVWKQMGWCWKARFSLGDLERKK